MKKYFVVCTELDDEGKSRKVLATHKLFDFKSDAIAYARTVAKSRSPAVLETAYVNIVWTLGCDEVQELANQLQSIPAHLHRHVETIGAIVAAMREVEVHRCSTAHVMCERSRAYLQMSRSTKI